MKIIKIFSKAKHRLGIFIEADNKEKYLLAGTLLTELEPKLKEINPANIPIDENPLALSSLEIKKVKVINTYNYQEFKLSDEDLKAVCVIDV